MRIGWLADEPELRKGYKGGAEYTNDELMAAVPDDIQLVWMPRGQVHGDVDAYVIHNSTSYSYDPVEHLSQRPFVKLISDQWRDGLPDLRRYILDNARLLNFNSPLALETFPERFAAPVRVAPKCHIQPARFAARHLDREGHVWLGRSHRSKGMEEAAEWALEQDISIDVYSAPPPPPGVFNERFIDCGSLKQADVPAVLADYATFVFLPTEVESYSRTTVEAWLAGCKLVVNGNVGSLHWIQNAPELLHSDITASLWGAIRRALSGIPDISVILPVYGCQNSAERAIRSVLDQQGVNVEIIAVNSASPDNVRAVLGGIEDKRLRIIHLDRDLGLGYANNVAIEAARGRYLHYLEGDDYLEPGCLRQMAIALDSYPRARFVYGCVQYHGLATRRFVPKPFDRGQFWIHNASLYPVMWRADSKARWHDFAAGIGMNDRDFILQLVKEGDGLALPDVLVLHYNFEPGGAWHRMQEYRDALYAELCDRHPELVAGA